MVFAAACTTSRITCRNRCSLIRMPAHLQSGASEPVLGFPISTRSLTECVDTIIAWLEEAQPPRRYLVCANPHSLVLAMRDTSFAAALHGASMVIPDGVGIVLASRLNGGVIRRRITGSDLFGALNAKMNEQRRFSAFFLGSTEETLSAIRVKMAEQFPHIKIAGTHSPPFRSEFSENDNRAMLRAVNESGADVLWVGMTAPKQEKWIFENIDRLQVQFACAVGAVFDFFSGRAIRSSPIFQSLGLEWLPRLLREPRRLWYRNFVSSPKFICEVLVQLKRNK